MRKPRIDAPVLIPSGQPLTPIRQRMTGGGLEGAERTSRETFAWDPAIISPDRQINPVKEMADARVRDSIQNDGQALGAVYTHRDSIVGSQYRLNAMPNWKVLGAPEGWADEFSEVVEARFTLMAESDRCFFDASGKNTFTSLIRLGVGGFLMTGEVLATVEWLREAFRPYSTAFQMVSPARLSNPDFMEDDRTLRRGVKLDYNGRPVGYWIRVQHPGDLYEIEREGQFKYVEARKPWGREQVIHIVEQLQPGQTRGIADMVAALKDMRMTRKFKEVTLQNAVVNASYAAAIESELPAEMIYGSMGAGKAGFGDMLGQYTTALQQYAAGAPNIHIDGAKMPHLFPGTKLNLKPMGTPGGIGTEFENSLLRNTAGTLGLSYEEFARDYTKTNYSSARASMGQTFRYMMGRKKGVADRQANMMYACVLEEMINAGDVPLPRGMKPKDFYDPIKREAFVQCEWIGASRGQIDEMKETQAALLRIQGGLSTYEAECGRLGTDWRRTFRQRQREEGIKKTMGLEFSSDAKKPTPKSTEKPEQREEEDEEV